MTIRNMEAFVGGLPDWAMLSGCFGQSVAPTDVDGLVEINGRFLLLEWKGPRATVKRGQARMFDALVSLGVFTVIVIWGESGKPQRGQRWPKPSVACDLGALRAVCSAWYAEASGRRLP
jgi:hypothetical protein